MRDGKLHATERQMKGLLKGQTRARHNAEIPEIPGAAEVIEGLEARLKKAEGIIAGHEVTIGKLWKWCTEKGMRPGTQERRGK